MSAVPGHILLVEGRDDEEVIYQLCNHHRFDNQLRFTVEQRNGYERLRNVVSVRPRAPGIDILGIVVDADADPADRWRSLCSALALSGYTNLPEAPDEHGTIIPAEGTLPRIGIWLMPDNKIVGMLEDFLHRLVREGDSLIARAHTAVDGIPTNERLFRDTYRSKAILHTWLAWQEEPGTPLGLSVTRRYLDGDHDLARSFIGWLDRLFPSPPAR
jgi:hypothetical protein